MCLIIGKISPVEPNCSTGILTFLLTLKQYDSTVNFTQKSLVLNFVFIYGRQIIANERAPFYRY